MFSYSNGRPVVMGDGYIYRSETYQSVYRVSDLHE